jgi:hypothetical protein
MPEQDPIVAVSVTRFEVRQAIAPEPGVQSLVLVVGILDNGNEVVIPLDPGQARYTAETMLRYADEIDGRERMN